jgi:hypothetical protein
MTKKVMLISGAPDRLPLLQTRCDQLRAFTIGTVEDAQVRRIAA